MGKFVRILAAIIIVALVVLAPRDTAAAITPEEAEKFVNDFYGDLAGDDLAKVMAHFDDTVEYYTSGKKERDFIANEFGQYFTFYPVRSFSVSAFKLKPSSTPDRVTVNFDLRSFLRNPDSDRTSSGRAHVDWDLVKRDGVLKIARFAGTAADTSPSPSPPKPKR